MSETTGPAPTGTDAGAVTSAADTTQAALSVSDAARVLRNQRRAQASQPVGIGHNSGEAPPPLPPAEPKADEPKGVAALEAALGLPPGEVSHETTEAPAPEALELDGRRWSHDAIREQIRLAADYTQKTQALAQQTRELQAQQQALGNFLQHLQPEIEALSRRVADVPRPDPALRATDPATYWDQWAQWQDSQAELQRMAQVNAIQMQARDAAMQQAVAQANAELARKYPFWSDPVQRREIQQDVVNWARTQGYTDAELQQLTNARYLETLIKARFYDKHVEGLRTRAPTPTVQPTAVRGAAPPPPPAARVSAAQEAFEASPSINAGAALIGARRAGRPNGHTQW